MWLAASLFAQALSSESIGSSVDAVQSAAHDFGRALGEEARSRAGRRPGWQALQTAALAVLAETGFEPVATPDGGIALRNCPFDALARSNRDLVCGMNLSLMDGVIAGLRASGITAELDPQPGMCCVVWRRSV